MFIRETRQTRADGTQVAYVQLVENTWDPAKKGSRTRVLVNFGRIDEPATVEKLRKIGRLLLRKADPEALAASDGWKLADAWPHGPVFVLEQLWAQLGLREAFANLPGAAGTSVERAVFAMVANRACEPASKLYCFEQWLREDVRIEGTEPLGLHHLYRAMDVVEAHIGDIEAHLYDRLANLLNLDVELIFYDTTSLHFEVDEPDEPGGLRRRGYSKNGRSDAPQVVVGLAVTRDGFPIRHWVFPGNTVDVSTVAQVKDDLRGWRLSRCLFVGDAGMISKDNLGTLAKGGGRYIIGSPMRRDDEVTTAVLSRPGRYAEIAPNLRVKEVVVGEGERRRRYVVCHNPDEASRQKARRDTLISELESELAGTHEPDAEAHSKRICDLVTSRRYGRYLRKTKSGKPVLHQAAIRDAERYDGKWVVTTNDDTLTPADLALGYKQLLRVEAAWRTLKTGLSMRPVYHRLAHRIRAHIAITVWALLLERVAESRCGDTWRNIRDDLKQIKLARLLTPDGDVWQVTEPQPAAAERLSKLGFDKPGTVVRIDPRP